MRRMRGAQLTAAVAVLLSGCGTVCNLASGNPDNYGGVQRDLQFASEASAKGGIMPGGGGGGTGAAYAALFIVALYGADVSLSFVGDTVTLPLAVYLRHKLEAATGGETGTGS